MVTLRLKLLGGFKATLESGDELTIKGRKTQGLLAILALSAGQAVTRDKLANLLWGDRGDEQARGSLRQALAELRRALGDDTDIISAERDNLTLNTDNLDCDVTNLTASIASGDLENIVDLYGGELLDGLGITDPSFEDWLSEERRSLGDVVQGALNDLLTRQTTAGETDKAIITARKLLSIDPLQETVHRSLMRLYADHGDRTMALKQYQACRDILKTELEIEPESETRSLQEEIRSGNDASPAEIRNTGTREDLPLPDKPSVAVLPFTNMSGDAEQEYFADGITEDTITGLSRFRELFVIARNSSFTYKNQAVDVTEAGNKLGVRYIVEGSVRKAGNRVRITAQLIEASTGNHTWAERYDRDLEDVFAIQDEVTETIVATLAGRLGDLGVVYAKRKSTNNQSAFDYVLHARQLIYTYKRENILKAQELLDKAIALDPEYAIAYAWLSETYWTESRGGWTADSDESLERSAQAAAQGLALDDTDPQVHLQIGQVYMDRHQFVESLFHFDKALSLNPNEPNALMMKSYHFTCVGDPERAITYVNEAIRVDPLGHYGYIKGIAHFTARNYDKAISAFKTVRGDTMNVLALLAACHAQNGDLKDARTATDEFIARVTKEMTDLNVQLPTSWSAFVAKRYPYKNHEDVEHLLIGLHKAGFSG